MSSCSRTSGGFPPNQGSSEATTSHQPTSETGDTFLPHPEYRSRLRPRPTRQTEHYKTPPFSRRLPRRLRRRSASETDIGTVKPKLTGKRQSEILLPSSSKSKVPKNILKKSFQDFSSGTSSVKTTAKANSGNIQVTKDNVGSSSKLGKRGSIIDDSQPLPPSSKHKKKLASHSELERKTITEDTKSGVKPPISSDVPTTSKPSPDTKSGAKPKLPNLKVTNRFPLIRKTKSAESKSRLFSKNSGSSLRHKLSKGESVASASKSTKSTSKTGSCASSRRGSERGKRSSAVAGSSDHSLPPDDACGAASNNISMHRSRHSREAANQQRASTDNGDAGNTSGSGATVTAGAVASAVGANAAVLSNNDSESEDSDITRLQALLEARGLPPHFFGNLGPRMQQILHRSMGPGVNTKAQQYLQGMQAVGDESRQLQAAIGMCQLLVMGNEDTLAGFPIKSVVPALINLLRMEHNFDLMNHACRALTYMMEALPRSSAVVVDAIPVFLEKLQVIQCMDVAEQSLTALDMLSRRHAPAILAAGGQSSCLLYIDFFSLPAQRSALSVAANCCLAIGTISPDMSNTMEEFNRLVKSSLPLLSSRLTHHDKKCVESACLCFVRLIDNYQQDPKILFEIAGNDLFKNFQQLLVVTPPLLSTSTFVMVIRSMTVMCSNVRALANKLVKDNIAETLRYLLCGTPPESENGQVELVSRSPQELFEITSLIGELLPRLPKGDPLFSINTLLWQGDGIDMAGKNSQMDRASWQWKDESGQWRPYIRHDSRLIEAAHASGEQEVNLTTMDRSYTIDFEIMEQINDDTGTTRSVQRIVSKRYSSDSHKKSSKKQEAQPPESQLPNVPGESVPELSQFIKILFTILYEVYSSSAGSPAVRHRCLRAIQRMVFYTEPELLSEVLHDLTVSSHISSMLSSPDIKVIVGALQLAEMLMQKLPDIFAEMFHREGVLHQVKKLTDPSHPLVGTERALKTPSSSASSSRRSTPGYEAESPTVKSLSFLRAESSSFFPPSSVNRRVSPPLTKAKAFAAALTKDNDTPTGAKKKTSRSTRSTRSSTSSFLSSLNPTKWGRSLSSALSNDSSNSGNTDTSEPGSAQSQRSETRTSTKMKRNSLGLPSLMKFSPSSKDNTDLDQVKEWVRDLAAKFLNEYFTKNADNNNKQTTVLERLTNVAVNLPSASFDDQEKSLKELSSIVNSVDVSSFELQHSGVVTSLLQYLTSSNLQSPEKVASDKQNEKSDTRPIDTGKGSENDRAAVRSENSYEGLYARIRRFLHIFAGLPTDSSVGPNNGITHFSAEQVIPLLNLVRKLNQCVGQLEQLPVKSHDLMSGGSQVLRVLSTRQLKCQLQRHPDCQNVKQWLGGPVKVDPLVQVQAIERYLIARGYGVESSNATSSDTAQHLELSLLHEEEESEDEIQEEDDEDLSLDDNTSECVSSSAESHLSGAAGNAASSSTAAFGDLERRDRKPSASMHKLEFYIGSHKLPHHITVYQAVRQYTEASGNFSSDDESDTSLSISENAGVWNRTHVIKYKLVGSNEEMMKGSKGGAKYKSKKFKGAAKQSRTPPKSPKNNDPFWTEGILPEPARALDKFLVSELPPEFSATDACSEVLCLLRVVHSVSRHWHNLYSPNAVHFDRPLITASEFINLKINAKCARQLQDPLIIITGQLTTWLQEIAIVCPFLLSFETRQLLFKITAFDRDRAMQHLLDTGVAQEFSTALSNASNSGDNRGHSSGRFMPRIEKKKCSVSRNNLLQQAERIIFDYGHSRAMIEVDYESEVGTGLGPTLEFFTLTSKELQKSALNLWREELTPGKQPSPESEESPVKVKVEECETEGDCKMVSCKSTAENTLVIDDGMSSSSADLKKMSGKETVMPESKEFVNSPTGLFPKPLGRTAKHSQVNRVKGKFRFLGKFLAKALLDGRMVDLPLNVSCYKWLLGEEQTFSGLDLEYIDPGLAPTFNKLKRVAHDYDMMKISDPDNLESVMMDGCPIEDLGLDMQLPGYPNVELMKLGRNIPVTIHNLDKYLKLMVHWTLVEGVRRQMEAMKEGFESVLPLSSLNCFFPEELDQLFCGSRYQTWDVQELSDMCRPDHGYTQDSPAVISLYKILSTYDQSQQRSFLQFVTGCPHLPVGGFRALNPRLTIVRKTCDDAENIDDYLPSVMTCLNYLKLPEYSSESIMRTKLQIAALEGQKSFLLS